VNKIVSRKNRFCWLGGKKNSTTSPHFLAPVCAWSNCSRLLV